MEVLEVPFIFDREEYNRRVKMELYEGMEEEIEALLDKALSLVKPKAVFREMGVGRRKKSSMEAGFKNIHIGNQVFDDPVILSHLSGVDKIYPYITTCGNELEELAKSDDMLVVFWVDALKQMAMDRAFNYCRKCIKERHSIEKLHSLNPGSNSCGEGWDMGDQKKLFSFFPEVEEKLGVHLTGSMLMVPNKTVSGIMFESDKDFVSCLECDKIHCPNRKMIHDGAVISL